MYKAEFRGRESICYFSSLKYGRVKTREGQAKSGYSSTYEPPFHRKKKHSKKVQKETPHRSSTVPFSITKAPPLGSYVDPETSTSLALNPPPLPPFPPPRLSPPAAASDTTATRHAVMLFVVRVPVLSEQITVVQPSVSTEGRERTRAFSLAMRRVPRARQVVTTAGRPSGMAATARATAT